MVKSLGVPQASKTWARRAFADENVQYMLLALFWYVISNRRGSLTHGQVDLQADRTYVYSLSQAMSLIAVTIIPFATFSLFHCLTFLRTNIIPKFVP